MIADQIVTKASKLILLICFFSCFCPNGKTLTCMLSYSKKIHLVVFSRLKRLVEELWHFRSAIRTQKFACVPAFKNICQNALKFCFTGIYMLTSILGIYRACTHHGRQKTHMGVISTSFQLHLYYLSSPYTSSSFSSLSSHSLYFSSSYRIRRITFTRIFDRSVAEIHLNFAHVPLHLPKC